jgi:hypothetical protein
MNLQKTTLSKTAKNLGLIMLIAFAINSWWIITQWYAVSSISTEEIAWIGLSLSWFLFLPLLFAPFIFLGSLIGLIFKKSRKTSTFIATFSLVFLITGIFSMSISGKIRHNAFVKLANNSSELIEAIKQYENQQGVAPETLDNLVPDFLPSIPTTDMGAYPTYKYYRCEKTDQTETGCFDNPWYLQVDASPGGINFDSFIYLPKQNYPDKGYGGSLERIENWAYVHE